MAHEDHGTSHEKAFIARIGKNEKALRGYLVAAKKRANWGGINSTSVITYASILLESLHHAAT